MLCQSMWKLSQCYSSRCMSVLFHTHIHTHTKEVTQSLYHIQHYILNMFRIWAIELKEGFLGKRREFSRRKTFIILIYFFKNIFCPVLTIFATILFSFFLTPRKRSLATYFNFFMKNYKIKLKWNTTRIL